MQKIPTIRTTYDQVEPQVVPLKTNFVGVQYQIAASEFEASIVSTYNVYLPWIVCRKVQKEFRVELSPEQLITVRGFSGSIP